MRRVECPARALEVFNITMKGLETGLKVGDIATYGFEACEAEDAAEEVLARAGLRVFDTIPVRNGVRVVGVLERSPPKCGRAADCMRPLDDSLLVAADEPLKLFIGLLAGSPYRLVVRGA